MSTYESLLAMSSDLVADFKGVCEEGDKLVQGAERIRVLIEDGVVDLSGPYLMRVDLATRRFAAGRTLGSEALEEITGLLRTVEVRRLRRDLAAELKDHMLVSEQEKAMAQEIPIIRSELENVFLLVEAMRKVLKELQPPRLVVA